MASQIIATIDLGSNSFHMLISEVFPSGSIRDLYRGKSKVQLRSGLQKDGSLSVAAQERALDCLENFALSLKHYKAKQIKVVGTYTLRKAKKQCADFLVKAEQILGAKIEVISGEEEARLIYVGASLSKKIEKVHSLIIDIGGGSTELVIGKGNNLKALVSLEMGCVSIQEQFFEDGRLTIGNFVRAISYANNLIAPIIAEYRQLGWDCALGASGTIRSISDLSRYLRVTQGEITKQSIETVGQAIMGKTNVKNIHFGGLREDRENILAGGFCVLYAIFDSLGVKQMEISTGALREGMLYELVNKNK